jgi:hypothetical protein
MLLEARTSTPLKRPHEETLSHVESPVLSQPVIQCVDDDGDSVQVELYNTVSDISVQER